MKVLRWVNDHLEEILMMIMLWAIVIVMFMQVIMRYVFKNSLPFAEELSRYCFIWMTFLGISFAVKGKSHIRIDIIETIVPALKKPLEVMGDIIFLAFCFYMLSPACKVVAMLMETNQTSPAMEAPMWIVYLSLLVGFILTIIRLIQKYVCMLLDHMKAKRGLEL